MVELGKMSAEMEARYNELALARVCKESLKKQVAALEELFRSENAVLFEEYDKEKKNVDELEDTLRSIAVASSNGAKGKFDGGVEIKEFTKPEYNQDEAYRWAIGHEMALKLDVTMFEKLWKAGPQNFPFVQTLKDLKAQIPTKLEVKGV